MRRIKNRGITLIALIITIIVMLILVTVSIQIALNTGLFDSAGKATQDYKAQQEAEQELGNGRVSIDNNIYNSIDEYIATIGENDTPSREELNIGDYVNYIPEGTVYSTKYQVEQRYSGYTSNQDVYLQNTKWRILNINSDGSIELISEKELYIGNSSENSTELYLKGATGYNNGVEILNDLCNDLYGTGEYATGARSLKIEDIQDRMDTSVWNWEDYANSNVDTGKYGGTIDCTDYKDYPARWLEEVNGNVDGTLTGGGLGQSEMGEALIEWDTTNSGELLGKTYYQSDDKITITQTYWYKDSWTESNFTNSIYYNLLITHEDGIDFNNWIASRFVDVGSDRSVYPLFGLSYLPGESLVNDDGCFGCLMSIWDYTAEVCKAVRPIVTLEADVQLTKDTKKSNAETTYWNLGN